MENTKMQPGKIYITTDDGKKLEFFGVVEFKPDTNEPLLIVEKTRCIDRPLRFIYEGKDITDQVEGMRHEIFPEGNRLIPDKHEQLTIETRRATLRFWDREFIMR